MTTRSSMQNEIFLWRCQWTLLVHNWLCHQLFQSKLNMQILRSMSVAVMSRNQQLACIFIVVTLWIKYKLSSSGHSDIHWRSFMFHIHDLSLQHRYKKIKTDKNFNLKTFNLSFYTRILGSVNWMTKIYPSASLYTCKYKSPFYKRI